MNSENWVKFCDLLQKHKEKRITIGNYGRDLCYRGWIIFNIFSSLVFITLRTGGLVNGQNIHCDKNIDVFRAIARSAAGNTSYSMEFSEVKNPCYSLFFN